MAGPDRRAVIWLPGLLVALGAAVATAHGLYEVAVAALVPVELAWLYPLITDGLALVAYAATARLTGRAARYAWAVVVIAAGLSGLAQAAYLAGGATLNASPALRFGVGAWPAVAAAVVAHLLYLLVADEPSDDRPPVQSRNRGPVFSSTPLDPVSPVSPVVTPSPAVQPAGPVRPALPSGAAETVPTRPSDAPTRDRAAAAAVRHARQHGDLPTVRQLMDLAEVSRGTAADALKALRSQPTPLHLVTDDPESRTQP